MNWNQANIKKIVLLALLVKNKGWAKIVLFENLFDKYFLINPNFSK